MAIAREQVEALTAVLAATKERLCVTCVDGRDAAAEHQGKQKRLFEMLFKLNEINKIASVAVLLQDETVV